MLIPVWLQTPYGYGESPNAFFVFPFPFPYGDSPYGYGDCVFGHPFSHALNNILFAKASHVHTSKHTILHNGIILRTHIDFLSLYHLGIILQSPFHYHVTSVSGYLSKEHNLSESPTTTAEGQQIHSGSGSGSGGTSTAAVVEVAVAEVAAATDWAIEGVGRLEGDALRRINAFYVLLKDWFVQKNYTSVLLTREGYNKQLEFGLYLNNGGDSRES
jgi:hypothetical protein